MADPMRKVLVLNPIHPDGLARLAADPGVELVGPGDITPENLPGHLAGAEAIIVRGTAIDRPLLAQAQRLRLVVRHGVGYDSVDVPALQERGIILAITPEANALSVAEHTLMLMLSLSRQIARFNASVRSGAWVVPGQSPTRDLFGQTVLLLGFGRIGTRVAKLCAAFGMRVLVHDPAIPANTIRGLGFLPAPDRAAALAEAEIVSLHCPSNALTRNMVDDAFLAQMRPDALLINAARGTLVDEAALERALARGHLRGVGIDVIAEEPMREVPAFLAHERVLVTPHVAASTAEGLHRMALASADNVLQFFAGALSPEAIVTA
ncbi:hypothetical protein BKE38_23720 [Pseudoroseomonas deserti]|uniref:Hydroxyacid dehydrogenase n=2 Tax=Teichococcus deserti TaxID=1817963 RepID=A0A1V2GY36_9PROT|nr:hypothetical protein BKE38_23720 [Pseudoroseomonas deserti]